jgi:DNA-binding response OmpR family regulator
MRSQKGLKVQKIKIEQKLDVFSTTTRFYSRIFGALTDRVWNQAENPEIEAVRTYTMNLRRKLGSGIIKTVHGVGYKIPVDIG